MKAMIALTSNVTGMMLWKIICPVFSKAMFTRSILQAVRRRRGGHRGHEYLLVLRGKPVPNSEHQF
jgi:hypothetical protein